MCLKQGARGRESVCAQQPGLVRMPFVRRLFVAARLEPAYPRQRVAERFITRGVGQLPKQAEVVLVLTWVY